MISQGPVVVSPIFPVQHRLDLFAIGIFGIFTWAKGSEKIPKDKL